MATASQSITDADILAGIVAPQRGTLSPDAAESLLKLRFSTRQLRRMRTLLAKNSAGKITPAELAEMDSYARVGNLLTLLKSKARLSLRHSRPA